MEINFSNNKGRSLSMRTDRDLTEEELMIAYRLVMSPLPSTRIAKDTDSIVWVKAKVNCPECGHTGDANARRGNNFTKCPNCGVALFNHYANGVEGVEDDDGYEYYCNVKYRN